ncbi:hypothetical protein [Aquimarina sp. AU474]|uniref:hypothetical protein n=1 Tax=Aquimarina sp. AU474 TaxID=2108529 RepID=UPI00135BFBED|nr:hypothetical protein [Aquimarina sp. AU474]
MVWMSLAGYGQNVGNDFTIEGIKYKITSATTVEIVDYDTSFGTEVTILPTITD